MNLIKGDCLEVMKSIPDASVDAIITDLPYGTTACKWDSIINFDLMWKQLNRIIKPNGVIALFGSEPFSTALRMSNIKNYKYDWIWEKNNAGNFQLVNYQPLKIHENISIFYNNSAFSNIMKHNMKLKGLKQIDISKLQFSKNGNFTGWVANKLNGSQIPTKEQWAKICCLFKIDNNYDELLVTYNKNVIETNIVQSNKNKGGLLGHLSSEKKRDTYIQTKTSYPKSILRYNRENGLHPTQKPVALIEHLIKTYTNENETVLDFTMGSGSTGVACVNTKRNFIGIELDNKYFEIAKKRIEQHKQQLRLY